MSRSVEQLRPTVRPTGGALSMKISYINYQRLPGAHNTADTIERHGNSHTDTLGRDPQYQLVPASEGITGMLALLR